MVLGRASYMEQRSRSMCDVEKEGWMQGCIAGETGTFCTAMYNKIVEFKIHEAFMKDCSNYFAQNNQII